MFTPTPHSHPHRHVSTPSPLPPHPFHPGPKTSSQVLKQRRQVSITFFCFSLNSVPWATNRQPKTAWRTTLLQSVYTDSTWSALFAFSVREQQNAVVSVSPINSIRKQVKDQSSKRICFYHLENGFRVLEDLMIFRPRSLRLRPARFDHVSMEKGYRGRVGVDC